MMSTAECHLTLRVHLFTPSHGGCHCPPKFEGPYCENPKGMGPDALNELNLKMFPAYTNINNTLVAGPTSPSPVKDGI